LKNFRNFAADSRDWILKEKHPNGEIIPTKENPMKHIFLYASLAIMVLALRATASNPEPCSGTILLTGMSNFQVRQVDSQTFVEFDFTGLHDICLADHSEVTGATAGYLLQRTSVNGDLDLRFNETLSYGGGTLGYRGEASLRGDNWQSQVMTVGEGTGALSGIHGEGTFWFTGPTSLEDVISYVYGR
jgi:opacity protein-like surface antigen